MLVQFKTLDNTIWLADTDEMKWARVDKPPIKEAPDASQILESGKLIPHGIGLYTFEGRTPRTPDPGAGLCSIQLQVAVAKQTCFVLGKANVPIKDILMPLPIETIRYMLVDDLEKEILEEQKNIDKENSEITVSS